MNLTQNTQAVILLTVHFINGSDKDVQPLTPTEWGRFAAWLNNRKMSPGDLLSGNLKQKLSDWSDRQITIERLDDLLNRGMAMGVALEKWQRSGLWVVTRGDDEYPQKLKKRLQRNAPPLFFGAGNRRLFNTSGLAVVGSRHVSEAEINYCRELGGRAAEQGITIVSGGARGADENAMLGALEAGGTAIGFLADRLLQASSSKKYREYIVRNDLLLVSSYNPEAGFNVGNAMGRNKYIYCQSDAAVVIRSDTKGGTWNGALENLKQGWVPLWVRPNDDPKSGNRQLVEKGAGWLGSSAPELVNIGCLLKGGKQVRKSTQSSFLENEYASESPEQNYGNKNEKTSNPVKNRAKSENTVPAEASLYELFCWKLKKLAGKKSFSKSELREKFELVPSQLEAWLKKAVEDGLLIKKKNPVRYFINTGTTTRKLFE